MSESVSPTALATASAVAEKASVRLRRATFLRMAEDGRGVVELGDSTVALDFATSTIPEEGEPVHLLTVDAQTLLLGPTQPKPGRGVVATVSDGFATVSTVVGSFRMPCVGTLPTSGDTVAIGWSEGPVCLGALHSAPPVAAEPPPQLTPPQTRSAEFRVIDTGSTDRGAARWWTDQPWASNSTYGAWFYGSQIKDTIPANAELVSLEFFVNYVQRQGNPPRFALHNSPTKAGVPTFGAYTEWAPAGGWQSPPDPGAWFNALKAGGSSWGVGLNQGGFNKFASRAADGLSGALRITWRS